MLIIPNAVDFPIGANSKVKCEGLYTGTQCLPHVVLGLVTACSLNATTNELFCLKLGLGDNTIMISIAIDT